MPDGDGIDLIKNIKKQSSTPIIMLTALGEPTDRIDIVYGHHNVNELEPFERYRISYYSRVPEGEDAEGYGISCRCIVDTYSCFQV